MRRPHVAGTPSQLFTHRVGQEGASLPLALGTLRLTGPRRMGSQAGGPMRESGGGGEGARGLGHGASAEEAEEDPRRKQTGLAA